MKEQFIYFLCGILGMSIQFLVGLQNFKQQSKAIDFKFVFKKYLQDDAFVLASTFLTILLVILLLPNVIRIRPAAIDVARILFALTGWVGSSILQLFFSPTQQKLIDTMQQKINDSSTTKTN